MHLLTCLPVFEGVKHNLIQGSSKTGPKRVLTCNSLPNLSRFGRPVLDLFDGATSNLFTYGEKGIAGMVITL